jgi:hypothetical protein
MKNRLFRATILLATAGFGATSASAVVTGFVSNPSANSSNWTSSALGFGASIQTIDFDAHPLGTLLPNFYPGVTLSAVGDVNTVLPGAGPGQSNTSSPPLSSGEGSHSASGQYLFDGANPSSLTLSFSTPVYGAGLFVIDYFNPTASNPLTIAAYTGANGTGTLLGTFSSVAYNFQPNNLYFMGITSSAGDIGSVVFSDVTSSTGDTTGIDDIKIATAPPVATPEAASSLALVLTGFGLLATGRRFRRN